MDKTKIIIWLPRITAIMLVLFLAMFSLDVFEPGKSAPEIAVGLFIHNIPALILLAAVIVAWKREIVGGTVFIAAGIFYIAMLLKGRFEPHMILWVLVISGPAFLVGGLYLLGWRQRKQKNR